MARESSDAGSVGSGFNWDDSSDAIGVDPVFRGSTSLDDNTGSSDSGAGSDRKRKPRSDAGKPRGTRGPGRPRKGTRSVSVDGLSATLVMATAALAKQTKIPEIAFDSEDADTEAKAIAAFLAEFPEIAIDPRLQAGLALIFATSTIVGPKLFLYRERMKAEAATNITPISDTVTSFSNSPFETQ